MKNFLMDKKTSDFVSGTLIKQGDKKVANYKDLLYVWQVNNLKMITYVAHGDLMKCMQQTPTFIKTPKYDATFLYNFFLTKKKKKRENSLTNLISEVKEISYKTICNKSDIIIQINICFSFVAFFYNSSIFF